MGTLLPLLTLLLRAATHRSAPRCEPGLVVLSAGCEDFVLSSRVKRKKKSKVLRGTVGESLCWGRSRE